MKLGMYLFFSSLIGWLLSIIFDSNFVGIMIVNLILSFVITNAIYATQDSDKYPFFKLGLSYFLMFFIEKYVGNWLNESVLTFFTPTLLWKVFIGLGFIAGLISSFGRYGNGTNSKNIETLGNFFSLVVFVLSFICFWWHGGLAYIVVRIPFIFVEQLIITFVFWKLKTNYERKFLQL
jgi:hypothetical protein